MEVTAPTWEESTAVEHSAIPSWDASSPVYDNKDSIINQTIMDYNANVDDEDKAIALTQMKTDPLDPDAELYFDKALPPKQRIEEMKKVIKPDLTDVEVGKIIESGGSVLSPVKDEAQLIADAPDKNERGIIKKVYDFWKTGYWNDDYVAYYNRMQQGFLPRAGEKMKEAKRQSEMQRRKFLMHDKTGLQRAFIRGLQNVKTIPLSALTITENLAKISTLGMVEPNDFGVKEALEKDINMWMESAAVPEDIRKDWAKNKGNLWQRPDFWANFLLESTPVMLASMATGGLASQSLSGLAAVFSYAGGSAATEALSNAGSAVVEADAMGATDEQKAQVATEVFRRDFVTSSILNGVGYGSIPLMSKVNPWLKISLGGIALGAEAEQELRQDEFQQDAIARYVSHQAITSDPWFYGRFLKGIINKDTRDVTIMSTFMGIGDPALSYMHSLKSKIGQTGRGKSTLDANLNYTKEKLTEELQSYKEKEGNLTPYEQARYDVLSQYEENDIVNARYQLADIDAKEGLNIIKAKTVEGILEDATVGEDAKVKIEALNDPTQQATPESINRVAESLAEIEKAEDGTVNMEEVVGLRKEDAARIREIYNLDELSEAQAIAWESVIANAKSQALEKDALNIAGQVLDDPDNRMLSMVEFAGLVIAEAKLQSQYDNLNAKILQLKKEGRNTKTQEMQAKALLRDIDTITSASTASGTAMARAFNFRKIRLNRETYSLESLKNQAKKIRNGKDITPKQNEILESLSAQIEEANATIAQLRQKLEEAESKAIIEGAQEFVDEKVAKVKKAKEKQGKENILSRRQKAIEELKKLGVRANMGVDPTVALHVGILAETYIEEGITKLPTLVQKLQSHLPEYSEQQVLDAFSRRTKKSTEKAVSDMVMLTKELKKQAVTKSKIIDGLQGIIEKPPKKSKMSAELINLNNWLQQLKAEYGMTEINRQKVQEAETRINEIQDLIENQHREIKRNGLPKSEELNLALKKLRETDAYMKTIDKIQELEEATERYTWKDAEVRNKTRRAGELKNPDKVAELVSPRARAQILNEQLAKEKSRLFKLRRNAKVALNDMAPMSAIKAWDIFSGSMMAATLSMDLGAFLRQGKISTTSHPIMSLRTLAEVQKMQVKGIYDKTEMEAIFDYFMEDMYNHPQYNEWESVGLSLTDPIEGMTKREEGFTASNWIEKIPYYGSNLIKASENAHVMYLDMIRIGLYEEFVQNNPNASMEEKKAWAQYVNMATGRGSLLFAERAAQSLTRIFLAPRWASSNFGVLFAPANWKYIKHKSIRNRMARDYISFIGTRLTFLGLAQAGGLGDVDTDPTSPDFLKLRIGNTRIDPWGGVIQPARLILGLMRISYIERFGTPKEQKKLQAMQQASGMLTRYALYKLSPSVNFLASAALRENVLGQKQGDTENVLRHTTPLIFQMIYEMETDKQSGVGSLFWGVPAEFYGLGVQSYKPNKKKKGSSRGAF